MKLPTEKLKEVEYYEYYTKERSYGRYGKPILKDRIVLHFGDWTKKWKLFGFTIMTETVKDSTEEFVFEWDRSRAKEKESGGEGEKMYELERPKQARQLRDQLEAYFDNEFYEVYKELQNHEVGYMTS